MLKSRPKVLIYYDAIIDENSVEKIKFDEFFLLRCHCDYLLEQIGKLSNTELSIRKETFRMVTAKCVETIVKWNNIQFVNASQTLFSLIDGIAKKNGMEFDIQNMLFDSATKIFAILLKRFNFILNSEEPIVLKECAVQTILKISTCVPDPHANSLLPLLYNSEFFDSLFLAMTNPELKGILGRNAFRILCILNCRSENSHLFHTKLVNYDQPAPLQAFIEIIRKGLVESNAKFIEEHCKEVAESSLIESFSSKISSLFNRAPEAEEVKVDLVDLEVLLGLFTALTTNPIFPSFIVSTRSSTFSTESSLLSEFLTNCSFCLHSYKSDGARSRAKMCLLNLVCLSDHSYIQNIMLDEHHVEEVPIFRPDMLHRPAHMDLRPPPTTIANSILALITEFITSNLKLSCHMEHFDLAMGVVHRILSSAQEMEKRIDVWRPLFNALISLLRFLVSNEKKLVNARPVIFRIMVVINLFLTSGDAFLPSLESYESLFYEIIRQQSSFEGVRRMIDAQQEMDAVQLAFSEKIRLHLSNVETIFKTIFPKLAHFQDNIEEHLILQVIRDSFAGLHLKIFDGQNLVDKYDPYLHQSSFFECLSVKIVGRAHELATQNEPPFQHYLEGLSYEKPLYEIH